MMDAGKYPTGTGSFSIDWVRINLVLPGPVETRHALSLQLPPQTVGQKRFQNQGKNTLSSIVGAYKSAVTKHAHRLGYDFKWQSRFHEHIIRNEDSYHKIQNYIQNNPMTWKADTLYEERINA